MAKRIDCRGLACPQPVLETKKALEEENHLWVLVDNSSAKENVKRFAESQGHKVSVTEEKGVFAIEIEKQKREENPISPVAAAKLGPMCASMDQVVFIDSDSLGRGSEELGKVLIRSLFHTLVQSEIPPQKVILMNAGVKLACEGSEVMEDLQGLASHGVEILACGTCLDYFGIKKTLRVGKVSNMYEILHSLLQAGKLIKL
jgi:selenium metabolism protein YedF